MYVVAIPMTPDDARRFAQDWIDAWNRRDVDAVVAHFADDVEFWSPRAEAVTGVNPVRGREAVRAYWTKALAGIGRLHFTLRDSVWDEERRKLVTEYTSERDDVRVRAVEVYRFRADGLVDFGEALYGSRL